LNGELTGTIKALLDEYKRAINELIIVIQPLSSSEITRIRDDKTTNPDCRSIQTILTHIIHSGYGYTNYIENHPGYKQGRPPKQYFENAHQYIEHLNNMFEYCETFFIKNLFIRLEETDNSKKITTSWGQQYDIDQLMEHAIVHILKHRRQIENFIKIQKTNI
jgi:uncharacterized damage-inducible protein DinB